jgi:hypothetical protein
MRKIVSAVLAAGTLLAVLGGGVMAGASAPSQAEPTTTVPGAPTTETATPTTLSADDIYGTGPSGDQPYSIPDCPVNTYVDYRTPEMPCLPLPSPAPQGTQIITVDINLCTVPAGEDMEFLPNGDERYTTSAQMLDLLNCILPDMNGWLEYEYGSLTPPPEWQSLSGSLAPNNYIWVPHDVTFPNSVACPQSDDDNVLFYCPIDGSVYLGEDTVWDEYSNGGGDSDISAAIGHEIGHRIQHVANAHDVDQKNNPRAEIPAENQADCISGALMAYIERQGTMDVNQTAITNPEGTIVDIAGGDDTLDMIQGILNVSEPEHTGRSHGTRDQRVRAFFIGYNSPVSEGAWACAFYFTDEVTIIPQDDAATTAETSPVQVGVTTTVAAAGPVPAPAPTLALPTGSTDPQNDALAQGCLNGDMQSCDDLFAVVTDDNGAALPGLETYEVFADTCGGRQADNTGLLCVDVFTSTQAVATTVAPVAPTTTQSVIPAGQPGGPTTTTQSVIPAGQPGGPEPTYPTTVVPAGPAALQQIMSLCQPFVLDVFHVDAVAGKVDDPGHVAEDAAAAGQTLDDYLNQYVADMYSTDGSVPRIIIGNPFFGADTDTDPPTEYGMLQGQMMECIFHVTGTPAADIQNYRDTNEGTATWSGYQLTWFFTEPDANGDSDFLVGLEVA